eukprot:TRINITY_DN13091_c0_g1_i3.p1 TRINITY_DN13091_c0_g1~~TRINITY_DN13091_c0_g1_i3.p1  ORF type:complete len:125 (-),score=6.42 TRINITY_DN13091_c0_g1_i3:64-438(-)
MVVKGQRPTLKTVQSNAHQVCLAFDAKSYRNSFAATVVKSLMQKTVSSCCCFLLNTQFKATNPDVVCKHGRTDKTNKTKNKPASFGRKRLSGDKRCELKRRQSQMQCAPGRRPMRRTTLTARDY